MIDPQNIVRYDYTDKELEELAIFCICVAGKTAITIAPRVHRLVHDFDFSMSIGFWDMRSPFRIGLLGKEVIQTLLERVGIGCQTQKAATIYDLTMSGLDLRTCTVEDLEKIKGIGPKTSRFFLMSSRENVQYAALDTHLLKWLKAEGVENVPKSTPKGKKYQTLEAEFLSRVPKGMTPAEFDLQIWRSYAK